MHRSGTSLITRWLSYCGINIGTNLLHGTSTNPDGHFEDLEVLKLHESILQYNGVDYLTSSSDLNINEVHEQLAIDYINNRIGEKLWSFKDPRASLFLDWWKSLYPGFKFIFIIRDCESVARSLLNRELLNSGWLKKISFNKKQYLHSAMDSWYGYNRSIFNFIRKYPEDSFVINCYDVFDSADLIVKSLIDRWFLDLQYHDIGSMIRKDKLVMSNAENSILQKYDELHSALNTYRTY